MYSYDKAKRAKNIMMTVVKLFLIVKQRVNGWHPHKWQVQKVLLNKMTSK